MTKNSRISNLKETLTSSSSLKFDRVPVLDPTQFRPVTHNEDYSFHRLPIDANVLRGGDCLAGSESEKEMLLFPTLYPNGRGAFKSASHPIAAPNRRYTFAYNREDL